MVALKIIGVLLSLYDFLFGVDLSVRLAASRPATCSRSQKTNRRSDGWHFGSCLGAVLISQQTLLNWNELFLVHADGVASCKQDLLDLQDEGQIQVLELFEAWEVSFGSVKMWRWMWPAFHYWPFFLVLLNISILLKNDASSMMQLVEVVEGWSLRNWQACTMHLDTFGTL